MVNKYCNNQKITINESWGKISGNIEDQKDLVEYIESHGGEGGGVSKEYVDNKIEEVKSEIPSTDDFVSHEEFESVKEKVDELPQADNIADKEWVEGQGYLTEHQPLKTINNQSLIGEGNIEIQGGEGGGLTPEQEDALGLLTDTHGGVLKTTEFKAHDYVDEYKTGFWSVYDYSSTENTTPGEFWFFRADIYQLYKFNPDTLNIETWNIQNVHHSYFWKDNSGRLYNGRALFNFDTLLFEEDVIQGGVVSHYNNTPSIYHIGDEILDVWGSELYIFNEETQTFEECQLDTDAGYYYPDSIMYYEGSLVCPYNSMKLVKIADKHYKWESWTPEFSLDAQGWNLFPENIHYIPNVGYFFYASMSMVFKLEGTEWVRFEFNQRGPLSSFNTTSSVGNFLIPKRGDNFGLLAVGDVKSTSWGTLDDEYVTSNGTQHIKGYKIFDDTVRISVLDANAISVGLQGISSGNNDLKLTTNKKINLVGQKLNFNGDEVAMKDDLIANTDTVVGDGLKILTNDGFGIDQIFQIGNNIFQCWHSNHGHIWDGSSWLEYEFPFTITETYAAVKVTSNRVFVFDGDNNIWEFVDGNWSMINDSQMVQYSSCFPLGDKLVVNNSIYYLDNDTNTWVEGDVRHFVNYPSAVKVFNGVTYYNDETFLYSFDGDNLMQMAQHGWSPYPREYFLFDNEIYVETQESVQLYHASDNMFYNTDIYFDEYVDKYFVYDNRLYHSKQYVSTALVQVTSYTKPEVPSTGEKYQLTGQVVDGKEVFTWEQGGEGGGVSQEYVDTQISQVRSEIPQLVEVNDDTSEWNKELGYTNEDNTMTAVLGTGENYAGILYQAGDHTSSVMLSTEGVEIIGENVKINDLDLSGLSNDKIVMTTYQTDDDHFTTIGEHGVQIMNGAVNYYLNESGIATYGYFGGDEQGISLGYENNKSLLSVYDEDEFKNVRIQADGITFEDGLGVKLTAENIVTKNSFKTINGESIIGDGNIEIQGGGSAPYVLGEMQQDESGEMIWTLNETDVAYILANQPDKIVIMDAFILNKFVGMEGDVIYNMTTQEDDSTTGYICEVTEDGGTFKMIAKEFVQTTSIWTGTEAEWNQLSDEEKASYTIALIR